MSNFPDITIEQLCEIFDVLHPYMDDYLYVYDFENDFYYISPHAASRFSLPGFSFHEVGKAFAQFVYQPDLPILQNDLRELTTGQKTFHNIEYRWLDKEGHPVWINCRGTITQTITGKRLLFGCINEIGNKQKADNVSGLLGISSLQTYLRDFYPICPNGYLLRLGLDDFKEVNEKLGIEYGDMILQKTAECINECLLPGQKLYRLVADEFMIIDFEAGSRQQATTQYKNIRQRITDFVETNQYKAVFTISGGIIDCMDIEECSYSIIMKLSEFALNEAKRQGKNRYYLFCSADYEKFLKKKELTQVIRQAVLHDFEGFEAYYQPLFKAEDNTLYGAETLMRFHAEPYGMVSPAEFIPILEETGLIIPAGRWILDQALQTCQKIQKTIPNFRISINVSYIQILKSEILSETATAVVKYNLDPSTVIIELTESGLLESDSRFATLWTKLKEFGVNFALDDFGTGYSNFRYLYDFKPDIIKIDRSFTAKALANQYEYNMLSLMSNLVHNLNLKICIEGIENSDELAEIIKVSPDYCQGFSYSRPVPYHEFVDKFVPSR